MKEFGAFVRSAPNKDRGRRATHAKADDDASKNELG